MPDIPRSSHKIVGLYLLKIKNKRESDESTDSVSIFKDNNNDNIIC